MSLRAGLWQLGFGDVTTLNPRLVEPRRPASDTSSQASWALR